MAGVHDVTVVPQRNGGQPLRLKRDEFDVQIRPAHRKALLALVLIGPLVGGCAGASMSDVFSSDLMSKDAQWFSRHGRMFIKNVSIETPPLTPDKPITPDDLVNGDGMCPGMAPAGTPADSNAMAEDAKPTPGAAPSAPAPAPAVGHVALGHTECDVARGIGVPNNVSITQNPGGERVAVLTYLTGARAGIYTFTGGRLNSIERAPEPPKPAKPVHSRTKKKHKAS